MSLIDLIKSFFAPEQGIVYVTQQAIDSLEMQLAIEDFAIVSAINLVASAVSKCEFRTYSKHKESRKDEYYLWNVEPNVNQNSSQFLQELVTKLLYYNECLVVEVNGQLIIADNFTKNEFAVVESYFSNVVRGTMKFDRLFRMSEVLYFRLGHQDIRLLLSRLINGYNQLLSMAIGKYKRSGGRKAVARVDKAPSGDLKFQEQVDELFSKRFKSYFEAENAVVHLPKGVEYEEQKGESDRKSTSDVVDIAAITKEAFERVAQAFKIPPALLRGDIADIEKQTDNFLTFCIDPLCDMIAEEINRKRFGRAAFLAGNYVDIDTTCIKHIDLFAVAAAVDKLIACGMYDIDELRRKLRDNQLNTVWSKKHWMTKNYTDIEELKGGEVT